MNDIPDGPGPLQVTPAPEPTGGSTPEPTGNPGVDAHLTRLTDTGDLATEGHLQVYEDVHRGLRETLTALDARPPGPAGPSSSYRQ